MSASKIVEVMHKLVQVHETFVQLAKEKTACLTKGDISQLQSLMQRESVYIKIMQGLEQERVKLVQQFARTKGLVKESTTITELLQFVEDADKKTLQSLQQQLMGKVEELKQQNEVNQQLIQDSLRFVNLSLDMIQPELDTGNYGRPNEDDDEPASGRSLFDSKA